MRFLQVSWDAILIQNEYNLTLWVDSEIARAKVP